MRRTSDGRVKQTREGRAGTDAALSGWRVLAVGIGVLPWISVPGLAEPHMDAKWAWLGLTLAVGCGLRIWRRGGATENFRMSREFVIGGGLILVGIISSALRAPVHGIGLWVGAREMMLLTAAAIIAA